VERAGTAVADGEHAEHGFCRACAGNYEAAQAAFTAAGKFLPNAGLPPGVRR